MLGAVCRGKRIQRRRRQAPEGHGERTQSPKPGASPDRMGIIHRDRERRLRDQGEGLQRLPRLRHRPETNGLRGVQHQPTAGGQTAQVILNTSTRRPLHPSRLVLEGPSEPNPSGFSGLGPSRSPGTP